MTTMTIGVDLHKRESQLCVLAPDGTATERRIVTSRERFTAVLGGLPAARVLLEASTESEWVARHLESLGHTVIVADPNCAPMYATRTRRVKTDKRDARALAEACRLGAYRPAHRLSDARRRSAPGPSLLRCGGGSGLRSSRSHGAWPGLCTRCGATARRPRQRRLGSHAHGGLR